MKLVRSLRVWTLVVVVGWASLSACSVQLEVAPPPSEALPSFADSAGSGESTPPQRPGDRAFGGVEALRDAALSVGWFCGSKWYRDDDYISSRAVEIGKCVNTPYFYVYENSEDRDCDMMKMRIGDEYGEEMGKESVPRLYGPNWIIEAVRGDELQEIFGGTLDDGSLAIIECR